MAWPPAAQGTSGSGGWHGQPRSALDQRAPVSADEQRGEGGGGVSAGALRRAKFAVRTPRRPPPPNHRPLTSNRLLATRRLRRPSAGVGALLRTQAQPPPTHNKRFANDHRPRGPGGVAQAASRGPLVRSGTHRSGPMRAQAVRQDGRTRSRASGIASGVVKPVGRPSPTPPPRSTGRPTLLPLLSSSPFTSGVKGTDSPPPAPGSRG